MSYPCSEKLHICDHKNIDYIYLLTLFMKIPSYFYYILCLWHVVHTFPVNRCLKSSHFFFPFLFSFSVIYPVWAVCCSPSGHAMPLIYMVSMFNHFQQVQIISQVSVANCTSLRNSLNFRFLHFAYALTVAKLVVIKSLLA